MKSAYGRALMLSLLGVVLLVGAGRRPRFAEGVLLVLFGLLALSAVRHIIWWVLVMTPFAARALGLVLADVAARCARRRAGLADAGQAGGRGSAIAARQSSTGAPLANALILVLFALVAVACPPWYRTRLPLPAARTALVDPATPIAVAEYRAAHPGPGELFHSADWGGYFGWRLGPDRKQFIDCRIELHPADVWRDYLALSSGHASRERLADHYGIGQLALNREGEAGLIRAVAESPNWTLAYENERAVLATRATVADSFWSRFRGLLGRTELAEGDGLVIEPCSSVHMLGMTFAVDALHLDRSGTVLRVVPELRPNRFGPLVWRSHTVLELPAGTAATGTVAGERVVIDAA